MKTNEFSDIEVINKLFREYSEEAWVKSYFKLFLANSIGQAMNIKIEEIKENEITIKKTAQRKLILYTLNNKFSNSLLFAYELKFEIKEDVVYGLVFKNKDEIIDMYCRPYNCINSKIIYYEIDYNIPKETEDAFERTKENIKNTFEDFFTEEEFKTIINMMLKKENLLIKNAIYRAF